jgi:phosphoribosylformylglycinamidine synthase subunit PurQ / glutaminase
MKVGVVVFPGSNCDHDAWFTVSHTLHHPAAFIWHDSTTLGDVDAVILPGGFAYGDYLRCGAIAKFSPVMAAVKRFAHDGGFVLGICNGFQVLTEAGLLPGALVRNASLKYVCRTVPIEVVTTNSPFTREARKGQTLRLPVGHGEGCYVADEETLDRLEAEDRVVLRYAEDVNGSLRNIAGIVNEGRNVMGLMPHPERAADPLLGGTDGLSILNSLLS